MPQDCVDHIRFAHAAPATVKAANSWEYGSHRGQYLGKRGAKPSSPLSPGCRRMHSCSARMAHHWYIVIVCSAGDASIIQSLVASSSSGVSPYGAQVSLSGVVTCDITLLARSGDLLLLAIPLIPLPDSMLLVLVMGLSGVVTCDITLLARSGDLLLLAIPLIHLPDSMLLVLVMASDQPSTSTERPCCSPFKRLVPGGAF